MSSALRIGVLGAAKISTKAMLVPALDTEGVEVVAIAARDRGRAVAQADTYGVPRVHDSWELSGGALMDLGCYPVQWARFVAGSEPEVESATMTEGRPLVDIDTIIDLRFAATANRPEIAATVRTAMTPGVPFAARLEVIGDGGTLTVHNPLAPHVQHEIVVTTSAEQAEQTSEQVEGRTTYHHQLEAFRAAVVDGVSVPTGGDDAIATLRVIDASYLAAGLPVRGT